MNEPKRTIPKRQHFVPKMLLKRFTDQVGKLFVYDKRNPNGEVLYRKPKDVFVQRHIYTGTDGYGGKDHSLEDEFAVLEGAAT